MNLIRKTYDTTEVQITSFQSSKGITEYHIFFQQTNCLEDFHTQLQHIQDVYARSVEELPGNPVAIFRRYFLSDVTNQTDELMKRERLSPYCALSIVQQAPMNGTKIALWAWLQTGVQTQVLSNGLFEARHGAYGQLLGANQCNRAANSEYQTRLIFRDYILQLTEANCTLAGQLPAHVDLRTECRRELSGCGKSPQRSVRDTKPDGRNSFHRQYGNRGTLFRPDGIRDNGHICCFRYLPRTNPLSICTRTPEPHI